MKLKHCLLFILLTIASCNSSNERIIQIDPINKTKLSYTEGIVKFSSNDNEVATFDSTNIKTTIVDLASNAIVDGCTLSISPESYTSNLKSSDGVCDEIKYEGVELRDNLLILKNNDKAKLIIDVSSDEPRAVYFLKQEPTFVSISTDENDSSFRIKAMIEEDLFDSVKNVPVDHYVILGNDTVSISDSVSILGVSSVAYSDLKNRNTMGYQTVISNLNSYWGSVASKYNSIKIASETHSKKTQPKSFFQVMSETLDDIGRDLNNRVYGTNDGKYHIWQCSYCGTTIRSKGSPSTIAKCPARYGDIHDWQPID